MGPVSHAFINRRLGVSVVAALVVDVPYALSRLTPRGSKAEGKLLYLAEQAHGATGALLAALCGPSVFLGWSVHVALDTISHPDGGATCKSAEQGRHVWCP